MQEFISTHWLDLLGTLIGLVYIYQEYKASIWLWLTGIVMPVVYMFVYYEAGLYADFGMQIYYALAAIYGFLFWKLGRHEQKELPVSHFPRRLVLPATAVFFVLWGALWLVLVKFTNSTVPVLDSFGNALSFIGLWALARKYIEQWWIWIVVDLELSTLYIYKDIPFTAALYALYAVIAVAGYRKWKRDYKADIRHEGQLPSDGVVILAAGDFPRHEVPLAILRKTKELYVCDGALAELIEYGLEPTAVIGDGDSISPSLRERYKEIYHQFDEQDDNDLTKATRFALTRTSERNFIYLGATGKREDHTLGNISLLMRYRRELCVCPVMITDHGWFCPSSGNTEFCSFAGQQVSIFNISCRQLSSYGLKWPAYPFKEQWQGTLNEALAPRFTVYADGDYLVYRTHEPKL